MNRSVKRQHNGSMVSNTHESMIKQNASWMHSKMHADAKTHGTPSSGPSDAKDTERSTVVAEDAASEDTLYASLV